MPLAQSTDGGAATRRLPIPSPSYRVSECGRWCLGYYRKRDGSLGDDLKFDHADVALWTAHKWREGTDGYLYTNVFDASRPKGKRSAMVAFHRLVVRAPGLLVDHRYGNKKDCRKAMLRPATHQQNSWNRRKDRRARSSRFLGVTLHRQTGKWQAQLKTNGVNRFLGLYGTEVEAAEAFNREAKATRGRFSVLNRITPKMLATARAKARARAMRNANRKVAPSGEKVAA